MVINGRVFSGGNVIIVNGQVISDGGTGKRKKFDERKEEDCSNIDKIAINSTIGEVNVYASVSSKVEAHLYGEAVVDGDVNFDIYVVNRELKIKLQFTGNCSSANLKLDITIPKTTFKVISVDSTSASVTLNEEVSTDYLKVKTQSGDLTTNATISKASISTMSGDVELCIDATQDILVNVSTSSGNVLVAFNNIKHINLSTRTSTGNVWNHYKGNKGYVADVHISTITGNIRVQ